MQRPHARRPRERDLRRRRGRRLRASPRVRERTAALSYARAAQHYHTTSWAPYTIGCYGPVDSQKTCKSLYQTGGGGGPAAHGQCDKEILPIYTPEVPEGYCYDTDCPCFDGDTDRYSRNTDMKIEDCACYDRCDTTSSGCKHTCDVLVNQMGYECDKMYCPTCKYAGWCDKTCGYAKCAK